MDEHDFLAQRFEENRTQLRAVAYRMLGSLSEADDAVQEAWLRLGRSDTSEVQNLGGWLTTVVGRVCLNMLRSRRSRHEELLADSVGLPLVVVLETLAPAERLAFVLHDMYSVPFEEIAPIVGRSPTAARQLASRARRRVQGADIVPEADLTRQREVVDAFLAASREALTSRRCSRCSTRTSCCESMAVPCVRANRGRSAACGRWPSRRSPSHGSPRSYDRRS